MFLLQGVLIMRLPMIATSVDRISLVDSNTMIEVDGIEPQRVACKLDLTGRRTRRECHGPSWARVCVNVPQGKEGQCREFGNNCTNCLGKCRDQFTRAGGWTVASEWGRQCNIA